MTKQQAIKLLKEKYLSNMKEDSELFVGVELEFPIVETNGNKTNIEVTKNLFRTLANLSDFEVEKGMTIKIQFNWFTALLKIVFYSS